MFNFFKKEKSENQAKRLKAQHIPTAPIQGLLIDPFSKTTEIIDLPGYKLNEEYDISNQAEYEAFSIALKTALNPDNHPNYNSSTTRALPQCLAYTDDIGLVRQNTAYWEFHLPQFDRLVRGGRYLIFKYGDGIEESISDYPTQAKAAAERLTSKMRGQNILIEAASTTCSVNSIAAS